MPKTTTFTLSGLDPGSACTMTGADQPSAVAGPEGTVTFTVTGNMPLTVTVRVEAPPDPPAVSTTVRAGRWADPATWDVPPAEDRDAVVAHAVVADAGAARGITVQAGAVLTLAGTLVARGDVRLCGTIKPLAGGRLEFRAELVVEEGGAIE